MSKESERLHAIIEQQRSVIKTQALVIREIMRNVPDDWKAHPNVAKAIALSDKILDQLSDAKALDEIPADFGKLS